MVFFVLGIGIFLCIGFCAIDFVKKLHQYFLFHLLVLFFVRYFMQKADLNFLTRICSGVMFCFYDTLHSTFLPAVLANYY